MNNQDITLSLYEWRILGLDSSNPTGYGVIATSVKQARNLLLGEFERQVILSPGGITYADIDFSGPYTYFCGSKECLTANIGTDNRYTVIPRQQFMESIADQPIRTTPISIGTTLLFSALDG